MACEGVLKECGPTGRAQNAVARMEGAVYHIRRQEKQLESVQAGASEMYKGYQLSLLDTGQGRGKLFGIAALASYLAEQATTPIRDFERRVSTLSDWLTSLKATNATEATLEARFISDVLCGVLGYVTYPAASSDAAASLYCKPSTRLTGIRGTPDAMLGRFSESETSFLAAVELKSPGTDLDLPQAGHGNLTPVEQAFEYGERILGVRWVLVSDMRIIRLYSVESRDEYEEIALRDCVTKNGTATSIFRKLFFLLHHDNLIRGDANAPVALLHSKSAQRQIQIRDGFYQAYYRIRADLFEAIKEASGQLTPIPSREELLEATQRLLDRLLFIYYCEDHPQQLIQDKTIERVTESSRLLPGGKGTRVYEYIKALFREIDVGSPPASGLKVPGYNGELFKLHRIIDEIDLPDSLHDKVYMAPGADGDSRIIKGVWGLHVYDFWSELNQHLLGHIFEESLSDLEQLGQTEVSSTLEKLEERRRSGIFYTASILSDFLSASAIRAILDESTQREDLADAEPSAVLRHRLDRLLSLRVVDFACGSGAFLVSAYRELLQEFWRLQASLSALNPKKNIDLFSAAEPVEQARLLPRCIFGVDILPQAVEIAKLSLWLRAARKDEKVLDLRQNILAADSLDSERVFSALSVAPGQFDLVIGNPPWGATMNKDVYRRAIGLLGVSDDGWDSWELFLLLGLRAVREGGRLALVLPDSFLYPEKARTRKLLLEAAAVEKLHNLGPDWFGPNVRMGTVTLQARRGPASWNDTIQCLMLAGDLRSRSIKGEVPLTQIESQRSRDIPVSRVLGSPNRELEVFRGRDDDVIIERMVAKSHALSHLCDRARGEEINKAGLLWTCPSCLAPTTPGRKKKGGGYKSKKCEACGHELSVEGVNIESLVGDHRPKGPSVTFIDGDDVNRRYIKVNPSKWFRLDISGWSYKDGEVYRAPKILVRQAGVGLMATLDETKSRCPQSVYIYRLKPEYQQEGYRHEFVLGTLLSRTMAYLVFKRFSEVDPDKAHVKVTHERLSELPIPKVDFAHREARSLHDTVVRNVRSLLDGKAKLGEQEDRQIEQSLRALWDITADEGAYINGEFYDLPDSQVLRDLFPQGRPKPLTTPIDVD